MNLILSCIIKGEQQTRRILERLVQAGISPRAIVVLHAGAIDHARDPALVSALAAAGSRPAETAVGAAASGSAVGGVFGWVVGFGVLALPGALLGGAVGAVAGAAIGATRHAFAPHFTEDVRHHYANRITGDHAAVLVQVENTHRYELVLMAFLDEGGRHILTSRNNPEVAESAQLEVLIHQPIGTEEKTADGRSEHQEI